jgi:anti-sigma factor (TIGR02949 family)
MKGCDEYSCYIQLYFDKEFCCQDLEEFRAHLQGCVACRQQLEAEVELSRLLRRSRPLYIASHALRERIMKRTAGQRNSSRDLPV